MRVHARGLRHPRRLRRCVLPVRNPRGPIGTATVVAPGLALTALHVITPENPATLTVGEHPGYPVRDVEALALTEFGDARELAQRSQRRNNQLTGSHTSDSYLGTVDLALLAVPGLRTPPLAPRSEPIKVGEHVVVPGYSCGHWQLTHGPVTGADAADFAAHLLLGPGASGAPALDMAGRLVGVVTLDHESATICIGPLLLAAFLRQFMVGT